jgi:hypothetical protein
MKTCHARWKKTSTNRRPPLKEMMREKIRCVGGELVKKIGF